MFDIIYGWRKWQHQRVKYWLLCISSALFVAIMSVALNLYLLINSDRPDWVESNAPMATVATKTALGLVSPTSHYKIKLLEKAPAVKQSASFFLQQIKLRVEDANLAKVNVAFYSENLFSLLSASAPFSSLAYQENHVFISQDFDQRILKNAKINALNQQIFLKEQALLITHILPKQVGVFANSQIDIWIPDRYLDLLVPSFAKSSATSFINSQHQFYGFAELHTATELKTLENDYRQLLQDFPYRDAVFVDPGNQAYLIEGIELSPSQKAFLIKQCWSLLTLIIGFGFILFSTLLSSFIQQAIQRKKEYAIKFSLGADFATLVVNQIRENMVFFSLIALFSLLFIYSANTVLQQGSVYQSYFNSEFALNPAYSAISFIATFLVITLCNVYALHKVANSNLFGRSFQAGLSKKQTRFMLANFSVFFIICSLAIVYTLNIIGIEKQKFTLSNIDVSAQEFSTKLQAKQKFYTPKDLQQGNTSILGNLDIALSSKAFTKTNSSGAKYATFDQRNELQPVASGYVSPNYFSVLSIPFLEGKTLETTSVVINEVLAQQIMLNKASALPMSSLIGQQLRIQDFMLDGNFTIAGIVKNAPHFGATNHAPVLYLPFEKQLPMQAEYMAPYFYAKQIDAKSALTMINQWLAKEQSSVISYSKTGTINQLVEQLNQGGKILLFTSGFMSLAIVTLLAIALYFQIKASFKQNQHKYGTMLALGMSKLELYKRVLATPLLALAIATAALLFLMILGYKPAQIDLNLAGSVTFIAWGIIFLMVMVFGHLALHKDLKKPIRDYFM